MALTFGLRFDRREAGRLRGYVELLRSEGASEAALELFDKAASDCADDEPLLVVCADAAEVKLLAQGFARHGFLIPTIDGPLVETPRG